jgi:hypothetical protein
MSIPAIEMQILFALADSQEVGCYQAILSLTNSPEVKDCESFCRKECWVRQLHKYNAIYDCLEYP